MRFKLQVAVIYYCEKTSQKLIDVAKALGVGIERQGHQARLVNLAKDEVSLSGFAYIVVGTVPQSLFSRHVYPALAQKLKSSGMVSGKKSFAFVTGSGLRKNRVLLALMKVMEREGMFLKKSDIIKLEEAEKIGFRLHIDKNLSYN